MRARQNIIIHTTNTRTVINSTLCSKNLSQWIRKRRQHVESLLPLPLLSLSLAVCMTNPVVYHHYMYSTENDISISHQNVIIRTTNTRTVINTTLYSKKLGQWTRKRWQYLKVFPHTGGTEDQTSPSKDEC